MNKLEVSLNVDKEMDNEVNRTKKRIWRKLHSLRFR